MTDDNRRISVFVATALRLDRPQQTPQVVVSDSDQTLIAKPVCRQMSTGNISSDGAFANTEEDCCFLDAEQFFLHILTHNQPLSKDKDSTLFLHRQWSGEKLSEIHPLWLTAVYHSSSRVSIGIHTEMLTVAGAQ